MLVKEHVAAGHEVLVIASTETYGADKNLCYVEPTEYMGQDNARVIRLPYRFLLSHFLMKKVRSYGGVYQLLEDFKPDVIMFHGMCGFELLTVARYVKNNPAVKLYADSHEDFNNSARNFITLNTLYRLFYVPIIWFSKKYINKVFYITYETKEFCEQVYKLKEEQLEFFPLGGVIYNDKVYDSTRNEKRKEFNVNDDEIVFFQSGKFDAKKKLLESITSFSKVKNNNFKYIIAGSIAEELKDEFDRLIKQDHRISFMGWIESDTLIALLCMADVYVQPGSQSATMQMSLAARCAVILDKVPSHQHIFSHNGFLVQSNAELDQAFEAISKNPAILIDMQKNSHAFAKKHLDYSALAKRLTK